jgi:hypothetical protein
LAVSTLVSAAVEAQIFGVGLASVRSLRFDETSLPHPNAGGGDRFAFSLAAGDFNGDGAADLAAGVPLSDGPSPTVDGCGAVVVRYGQLGKGLANAVPATFFGQFTAGSTDPPEILDLFGIAVVACDLNGDAFADLAVGVPRETLSGVTRAGAVEVYYGSSTGLVLPAGIRLREKPAPGESDVPTEDSFFGGSLGCGDFDGDGFDDLAVGLSARDLPNGAQAGGRVNVFPGSIAGVGATHVVLDQTILGNGDPGEANENFGLRLAAGDFDADGFDDLAVAVPSESAGAGQPKGGVQFVYGGANGLPAGGSYLLLRAELGAGDPVGGFGSALAAGDFDADGYTDLAVGAPQERVEGNAEAGAVFVLYGTEVAMDWKRTPRLSLGLITLSGSIGFPSDRFGASVAAGDFDQDGDDDVAIGVPGYESFSTVDSGALALVSGSAGTGLDAVDSWFFDFAKKGLPGDPAESNVRWTDALAAGDFDGDAATDLAVGAPQESSGATSNVGSLTILHGALFADGFEWLGALLWSDTQP